MTVAVVLAFLLLEMLIVIDGLHDDIHAADVAIVPGNTIEPNGLPSARLRARLDRTVELYRSGLFPNVIVSGGVGSEGFDEAEVMKKYLAGKGVPAGNIYVDNRGATTILTARNASRMMREHGWGSAMAVSQYFHVPRMVLSLHQVGIDSVSSAHATYFEGRDLYSGAREVIGYGAYLLHAY
jgi:vancomycin permeability regulator SanA